MTLLEFKNKLYNELTHLYPKNEIDSFFKLLISYRLNLSSIDVGLNPNTEIKTEDLDFFLNAFAELKLEKPIQYIVGETEFYGLLFKVTKNTLIPRPETEELVDWVFKDSRLKTQDSRLNMLDIGTGSGCIAISLAKYVSIGSVFAFDISDEALKIAQHNAELNDVTVNFIKHDILQPTVISNEHEKSILFDVIVSNPPYVRNLEKEEISNNVLKYEPHLALFVKDEDPLIFYDKIADFAKERLSKNGYLYLEINQYLSTETIDLLKKKGFKAIELKKDIFENYRMVKASLSF